MREIKFRGYDEENNVFRYGYYTMLQSGARLYDAIIVEDKDADQRLTSYYIHNHKTVGQYTGLKDKNGEEIYEGDILAWDDGKGDPWLIAWNENECRYTDYSPKNKAIIIGNIHENPELLEEMK